MRKVKSGKRSSVAKGSGPKHVEEYLAAVPEPTRTTLNELRAAIRSAVPASATEIISYRIPAFKDKQVLVWYAAFTNHCSLFPTASVIAAFRQELRGFSTSKGTIQFPLDQALPIALIKKIMRARVTQAKRTEGR